ncbi:sugar ABC transporter ATP-binding protein [Akkermansiaceae bacterium]|nr:sugar ABC transporter ATP-binding protein [Akkermansiaceae bacterium]
MAAEPILETRALTKRFPGVVALDGVSFDLRPGEIHALCGENGAGKSTLIKTLSGIHPAGSYEGEIRVDGQAAHFRNIADAGKAGLAVIYQELALVDDLTVAENIFLGNEPIRLGLVDWDRIYRDAAALLERFKLDIDPSARTGDLGTGMKQLVEIVKALSKNGRILILDEPTAALTEAEVDVLLEILRKLRADGLTAIYISHKLDEVFAIADRITVLRDGKSITTLDAAASSPGEVIRHMVGRRIEDLFPKRESAPGGVLLSVKNLTVRNSEGREFLHDISFDVRAGEVLGIGGLMGSGRSETLMHLFGAWGRRVSGTVELDGKPMDGATPRQAISKGLAMVTEDRKRFGLHLDQSVGFNLSLSSLDSAFIDPNREVKRNGEIFRSLRVKAPSLETVVGTLSGGNQQKVVIGKALLTDPRIVFLDEPTRGIDVGAKIEVYGFINRLTEEGKAVVLVSSELPELIGMSDRIVMLAEGRVGGVFRREEATQERLLAAAIRFHKDAVTTHS